MNAGKIPFKSSRVQKFKGSKVQGQISGQGHGTNPFQWFQSFHQFQARRWFQGFQAFNRFAPFETLPDKASFKGSMSQR
jgi:hypothetical protein